MSNLAAVTKDFIISALIAFMTADLLKMDNLIYQIIISALVLVIIFLLLRSIDKLANRVKILSVIYCENFIRPLLGSLKHNVNTTINDLVIDKFKIIIILPRNIEEINTISTMLRDMPRYTLVQSVPSARTIYVYGKLIDEHQLIICDTPSLWLSGLNYYVNEKKLKKWRVTELCTRMNEGIRIYAKKNLSHEDFFDQVKFIVLDDFKDYYG